MPTKHLIATNDPRALLARIKSEFPDLSWDSFKFLNHGWDHEVIILDKKLVFRFPNSTEYLSEFKKEIKLLEYLSGKISVSIPKYNYVAKDWSFGGYPIVSGRELTPELFKQLSGDLQQIVVDQLASFLSDLHSIPVKDTLRFNVHKEDLAKQAKEIRANAQKYLKDTLGQDEYKQVLQVMDDVDQAATQDYTPVLAHNDISPSHIIWDDKAKTIGIIDFSDRAISDPALDFAELFFYDNEVAIRVFEKYSGNHDKQLLSRAKTYLARAGVYLMSDSYTTDKVSLIEAKNHFNTAINVKP